MSVSHSDTLENTLYTSTLYSQLNQVSMKQKLSILFLVISFLLISQIAGAFAVFTVNGVKLVCPSCNCASMQAAGVNYENCADAFNATSGGNPSSAFDKIIRYSNSNVTIHGIDGSESPLASDDIQQQFDELIKKPGWEKQLSTLKIASGKISEARLNEIARQMSLPIENKVKMAVSESGKKFTLIGQLSANEGATRSAGVSYDLRIIPNASIQLNRDKWGLGLDFGTYNSKPDFNFDNYYKQIDAYGAAVYENANDHWKSTYFSIGPQYTIQMNAPGSASSAAKSVGASSGVAKKSLSVTFSLKGGYTRNKSPEISIYDSLPPHTVIATYKAPDSISTNGFNIKPGVALTYWFTENIGATVNLQYLFAGGQDEFKTGYRDLSKVNFGLNSKEVWYQITRSPVVSTTTKGPGNMLSFGAGISVKFGVGKPKASRHIESTSSVTPQTPEPPSIPAAPAVPVIVASEKRQDETGVQSPAPPENETKKDQVRDYIRPSILAPADGSAINGNDSQKPVILSWTAVLPPPPAPVVYHVKLVEVNSNQQPEDAIRVNKTVFEKDIDAATTTAWTPPQTKSGEVKKYAWTVRATDKAGKPFGENNGTSDMSAFVAGQNDIDIAIDTLDVACCKDGKQLIKITIKNNLPNNNTSLKKVWIMAVNGNFGLPYPIDITANVSPPLPYNFLPSLTSVSQGRMNFTASINCISGINNIVIKAEGDRNTNLGLVTDNDLETDTLNCICLECDKIKIDIPDKANINYSGSSASVNVPVAVSPKKVTKITADVVYFSFTPESEDCAPCNKDSKTYGNIGTAALTASGFPSPGAIAYGHEVTWNSLNNAGSLLNGQFSFNITMPPLVKCCSAKVRFCIRYSFQFDDCTVCDTVVCYSFNKEGCNK